MAVSINLGHAFADTRPPNIVLLISDDHDYEHLGFMGNDTAHTPTLDRLARAGTTFTHAHVPMSRCRPALASLLSGQWPHQTGVYATRGNRPLDPENSLPALLKKAGYATYVAGKYWEGDPRRMGFTHGSASDKIRFARDGQADLFAFIDEVGGGEQPLFIWWAPMLPHKPRNPPQEYLALFDPAKIPVPAWVSDDQRTDFIKAEHVSFAMEAWLDASVGDLVRKLGENDLIENTLFAFVIDNGWCNMCLAKGSAFEKGFRTPIFLTWPREIRGGRRLDYLTSSLDLYPTILEYAGVTPPSSAAGRSLKPFIDGRSADTRDRLFGAVFPGFTDAGSPERDVYALYVRERRWKYILYLQDVTKARNAPYFRVWTNGATYPSRTQGSQDLYDLEADPAERNNLSARPEHADRLASMREAALAWWQRTGGKPLASLPAEPPR